MMDNLVTALYGAFYNPQTGQGYVTKSVVNGRIVWTSSCDPSNATSITGIPRNDGEGLLCYILRILTLYNPTTYAQINGNGTQVITATNFTNSTWTGGTITNPSGLTKNNVGLNNVDNTADANKPTSGPQQTYIANAITAALAGFVPLSVQSLAGGTANAVPYQAAPSVTAFLPIGAAGFVLTSNGAGTAPSWQASANVNTNANNIISGLANQIVYQTAPGNTGFLPTGTTNYVLKSNGSASAPSWVQKAPEAVASDTAVVSTNIAGGAAGGVPYQTGAGATAILAAGTGTQVLGGGTTPAWQNVDTAATNDTLVKRTATGEVNATGFVGATFSGNSATASGLTAVPGLSPGTYGSSTGYPIVTINTGGQVTGISVQNAPAQPTVLRFPEKKPGETGFAVSERTAFIDSQYNIRVAGNNPNSVLGVGDEISATTGPGFLIASADWLSGERPEKLYLAPRNMYVLTNLGNIYSTGQNAAGQLGRNGTTASSRLERITTINNVVDFAVNVSHTGVTTPAPGVNGVTFCLAARSDGTLWGWGYNATGQLGNSSTANVTTGPVQITANGVGAKIVRKVYCNGFPGYSFFIDDNKEIWATGYNASGNLGINSVSNVSVFTRCVDDSLNPLTADEVYMAGAYDTVLAESSSYILLNNQVYSTGGNTAGQLGQGNTSVRSTFKLIAGGLPAVSSLALSSPVNNNGNSVAAITTSGALWVWGNNTGGQLAVGGTANQVSPTAASGLAGLTVTQVEFCGGQNAIVAPNGATRMHVLTSNGVLRTAGCGGRGFGQGTNPVSTASFLTAIQNGVGYNDIATFGSQANESILLRGTDGNLYAFGYNPQYQLGVAYNSWVNIPQKVNFY